MTEPPGARLRVGLTGLTVAEYFRDVEGRTCCSSSTTSSASRRPAPKCRRCSAACPPPSATSPTSPPRWASCRSASPRRRRARSRRCRRSTSRPTTSPIRRRRPRSRHLDATTVLSRQIAELGIYPGRRSARVDLAILDPRIVGDEHYNVARACRPFCRSTRTCRTSSPSSASTSCRKTTSSSWRARKIQRFLSQPFYVAEQFTGIKGKYVKIADTIRGFKRDRRDPGVGSSCATRSTRSIAPARTATSECCRGTRPTFFSLLGLGEICSPARARSPPADLLLGLLRGAPGPGQRAGRGRRGGRGHRRGSAERGQGRTRPIA